MAHIHPFHAWHPDPSTVKKVSCPPYDVVDTGQAQTLARGNPISFLHIIRPEIDLPAGTRFNDASVYKKGAENLQRFMDDGTLSRDDDEALYIYQLVWQNNTQTGIFGCVSVQDYDEGVILKHELTRPDKEDDRTCHIISQQAHAEPVMLTCKDEVGIGSFSSDFCENHKPLFDFKSPDGITHRLWKVDQTEELKSIFANLNHLYIADGHHRCKSASRAVAEERKKSSEQGDDKEFNYFPAVIFPMSEMNILAYNRVIHHVPDDFLTQLKKRFDIQKKAGSTPKRKGNICLYIESDWLEISLPQKEGATAAQQLDAYRLQHFIFEPLLGIQDPRRDENISFVGGVNSTDELQNRVDAGKADLAISMHPTAIEELVEVSDQHLLMPPKSTWFEPKLRSGLLVHTF